MLKRYGSVLELVGFSVDLDASFFGETAYLEVSCGEVEDNQRVLARHTLGRPQVQVHQPVRGAGRWPAADDYVCVRQQVGPVEAPQQCEASPAEPGLRLVNHLLSERVLGLRSRSDIWL
jgi:hypothetical protein